jgi:hypothetical protein
MLVKHAEQEEKRKSKMGFNKEAKKDEIKKEKTPKWKLQSEQLRNQLHNKTGGFEELYTLCDYCNRKYNEQAYNKHLNHCKNKNERNGKSTEKKNLSNNNLSKINTKMDKMDKIEIAVKESKQKEVNNQKPNVNLKFKK